MTDSCAVAGCAAPAAHEETRAGENVRLIDAAGHAMVAAPTVTWWARVCDQHHLSDVEAAGQSEVGRELGEESQDPGADEPA
jgi:hypothetical protein